VESTHFVEAKGPINLVNLFLFADLMSEGQINEIKNVA